MERPGTGADAAPGRTHRLPSGFVPRTRRSQQIRRQPQPRSSHRRFAAIGLVAAALLAAGGVAMYRMPRSRAPVPPTRASLGSLAPEIEDIVRQARESVAQDPRDGVRWGRFGMVCEANGLVGAARDGYANATQLQPSEAKWWFHLAAVEARMGRIDDAVRNMRRAIEINPAFAPAQWRLGLWLLDQNQLEGAEHAFGRATETDASDRAGWVGLARVYLQRGDTARAAGLLERLVASGPSEPYTMQLLGTAYRRLGRADEAASAQGIGARGEAQWSDPWTDEMLSFRRGYAALLRDATAYVVAGQLPAAIRILEQLRIDKPNDTVLMAHLGQVYVAAGRDAEAVPLLERAIASEPDRFEAYVDLATAYMHQDNLAKARATVEHAVSLNPAYAPARETLGLILWRGGDSRDAIAAFDASIQRDPRNVRAMVWMAMVLTNLDRTSDALAAFRRAARTDPTSVDAWIGIANAEMNGHDLEAAAEALKNAQRFQPDRPAVTKTAERLQSLQAEASRRPRSDR
jgi:tetratricopeptide (TPR) repeat protein